VNKIWLCIIFIGPDNTQYTSKPSRGLYTVSQHLVQSKGGLSNETTSERCSRLLNVNAQVTLDTSSRLLRMNSPECLPSLTFYSRWRSCATCLSFAQLRNQSLVDLTLAELQAGGERWLTQVDQMATKDCFHANTCKVTRLSPLGSKYKRVHVLGSLYIFYLKCK